MNIQITLDIWRAAVDVYLDRLGCPRKLCDMARGIDSALEVWFLNDVTAHTVASVLSTCTMPPKATLNRDPLVPREARAELQRQAALWRQRSEVRQLALL